MISFCHSQFGDTLIEYTGKMKVENNARADWLISFCHSQIGDTLTKYTGKMTYVICTHMAVGPAWAIPNKADETDLAPPSD